MPKTRTEYIAYGDNYLPVQVPARTRTIRGNPPLTPIADVEQAVRHAISNPIAHEPLGKLVGPKSKVTIAFDDASGAYSRPKV